MCDPRDFIIENGVLKRYTGPGGDVVIPEGVTSIGRRAFWTCSRYHAFSKTPVLISVTIPASVETVEREAFRMCTDLETIRVLGTIKKVGADAFPISSLRKDALELSVYSAIPISAFTKAAQDEAARVFVRRFSEFDPCTEVFRDDLSFIGAHLMLTPKYGKPLYQNLLNNEPLRHAMLEADAIPVKDVDKLVDALHTVGDTAFAAELLDYKNRLLSNKKIRKSLEKSEARAEQKALSSELSAAEWRKRLKIAYEGNYAVIKGIKLCEQTVTIPGHIGSKPVRVIDEQAFFVRPDPGKNKVWSPKTIIISEGVEEIRSFAFDSTEKAEIFFPKSVSSLPIACFIGVKDLTLHLSATIRSLPEELARHSKRPFKAIHAPAGSYAEQYAKENNIPFVAE